MDIDDTPVFSGGKEDLRSRDGGWRRWLSTVGWGWVILVMIVGGVLGYGISGDDCRELERFNAAVERWQRDPDFRQVGEEYVTVSNAVLNTRPFGVRPTRALMGLRVLPFLPESLKANADSQAHYDDFTAGRLRAYLRLASEQGVDMAVGMLEGLGKKDNLSDEDVVGFLGTFHMEKAIVTDGGAVAGVRKLIGDASAGRTFKYRGPMVIVPCAANGVNSAQGLLVPYVAGMARKRGWPEDVDKLSREQQNDIVDHLDVEVKGSDRELWRTKQFSDFLAGMWAQSYGATYGKVISVVLWLRVVCRVGAPLALVGILGTRSIFTTVRRSHINKRNRNAVDEV